MTGTDSPLGPLHRALHRIPGVPTHAERPAGHQGTAVHGHPGRPGGADVHSSRNHSSRNHSPARPPRFMAAWQGRIAAFFGREV